jgi:hypothetical protein
MLGCAVGGNGAQSILRDVTHQSRRDLPDRPLVVGRARDVFGGFQDQGDLLMLGEPHRLQRAKHAVLVDRSQVL